MLPAKKVYTKVETKPVEMDEPLGEAKQNDDNENTAENSLTHKQLDNDESNRMLTKHNTNNEIAKKGDSLPPKLSAASEMKFILTSPYYLLHLYWFSMLHLRVAFFCSGFNPWVKQLTGNDEEGRFLHEQLMSVTNEHATCVCE